ncbi:MAG: hypothetical protein HPY81_02090 [Firmicutes bacterium]|nr:hypothetical protein [Bacillota bacterium]
MIIITISNLRRKLITLVQLALLIAFLGGVVPQLLALAGRQFFTSQPGNRERGLRVEQTDPKIVPVTSKQTLDRFVIKLREFYQVEKQ